MTTSSRRNTFLAAAALVAGFLAIACIASPGARAGEPLAAKALFGAKILPAALATDSIGFYAKGCLAGAVELPATGPTWQVMRPSRNRAWGNPAMIRLIERLSRDAAARDGWPGLLVGDISQPRGGPMVNGHASHQIGLDADVWLTPMPNQVLSVSQRETMQATSMVRKGTLQLDPSTWTDARARLIMRAAGYPEVQRIFVHPAIKKRLCDTWRGDRSDLGKVRPYWGHMSHMHIRIRCPGNSPDCKPQHGIPAGDGCGRQLAWWFTDEPWKPAKPGSKPAKPRATTLADLPTACRRVLQAPAAAVAAADAGAGLAAMATAPEAPQATDVPVPQPRPESH